MADEKITYEIVVDDSQATGAVENLSEGLGEVSKSATKAKESTMSFSEGLNKMVPGLGGVVSGFQGMVKGALAFIATPIGAVVAALGLAIGALTKYFKGSEEGQNNLNKIMAVGSAIMEKLGDLVEWVGEKIFNAFSNPKQALIDLVDFIKQNLINRFTALAVIMEGIVNLDFKKVANGVLQMGTGIVDVIGKVQTLAVEVVKTMDLAVQQGLRLAELSAKIDEDERKLLVARAKTSLEVSKLREEAVKQEGETKKATIMEAIKLEEQLAEKEVKALKRKLEEAQIKLELNGADKEAKLAVAQAEAAVITAEAARHENTLRFRKEIEAIDDAEREKKAKQAEEDKEAQDKADKDEADRQAKLQAQVAATQLKNIADAAAKEKKIEEIKAAGIQEVIKQTLGERVNAQKLYTTLFKKGALSETYINTKAGAEAAYKAMAGIPIVGPILGALAAAAAIAFGVEQATGIQAIQFARGGLLRGPRHRDGGIPITVNGRGGYEAEGGEAIINRRSTAMFRDQLSAINAAGGGVRFETGGITPFATSTISNQIDSQRIFQQMVEVMQATSQKVLVLEEFESVQNSVQDTKNRATV